MNHHLAKTYRRKKFILILVLAFILFFVLAQSGMLKRFSPFFTRLVTPIWQAENFTADFLALSLDSKKDLYKQNILLKEDLAKKDIEIIAAKDIERENIELKATLGRVPPGRTVVLSGILAKPNQTPYDTLIIDRGEGDGIVLDQLVFAQGDVLIGEIDSVEKSTAKVLMYSTPGNILQVVYGSTGRYFNARGLGNGSFEVEVSREVEVFEGDLFFYPGLDNTLVGVVRKVEFDPRDSFKKVLMKSPINIQEERWVEVRI